jgi:hypothetical protein
VAGVTSSLETIKRLETGALQIHRQGFEAATAEQIAAAAGVSADPLSIFPRKTGHRPPAGRGAACLGSPSALAASSARAGARGARRGTRVEDESARNAESVAVY